MLGEEPVRELAEWWQKQPGVTRVGLIGFTVAEQD
jgi:hypothetical protein